MLVVHWLESLMTAIPAAIQCIETENKKLFGNELSPDHPLQKWSADHNLPLRLRGEETVDVALRVECPLSILIPALTLMKLDDYLQQISEQYNRQWSQKKLGGMTPEGFWALHGQGQ